jgi:hypothetical protein
MAKPVITPPASQRNIAQGVAFSQALAASGTPTVWAASALPSGLTISDTTGTISGIPLVAGVTTANITATNGDGTSDAVTIIFIVSASPVGDGNWSDIVLDLNVITREVTIPGVDPVEGEPLFDAPLGTNLFALIGVTKWGVLQDLKPGSETILAAMGLKELETERLIESVSVTPEKTGSADLTRFRIPFRITRSKWISPLSDYEDERGTELRALADVQFQVGEAVTLYDDTETATSIAIEGSIESGLTRDLTFTGLDEFAEVTPMKLTLTLAVAGRISQTVEFVRYFSLLFTGGVFVISDLSGSTSGQGLTDGTKWRATLALTGITGGAANVVAACAITTTDDTTIAYPYVDLTTGISQASYGDDEVILIAGASHVLELWDGDDEILSTMLGTWTSAGDYATPAVFCAAVEAAWEADTGINDVVSVVWGGITDILRINLTGSAVTHVRWAEASPTTFIPVVPASPAGTATTASITGVLEQLEGAGDMPLNLTSRLFEIGISRDISPD